MTQKLFSELGLSDPVLQAIDRLGYEKAAPIQAEAIPLILAGHDVVGQSQTGSGKTAAFAIPAVEFLDPKNRAVQALVLCPTRELAIQVSEEIYKLSALKRGIHSVPIYGGQSYDRQIRALKQGVQIVIGTPGRILDHLERRTLRLDTVRMVVLDEADEMLDMGFRDDIEKVLRTVPEQRQFICFSATMSKPILELIKTYAPNAKTVRIEHKILTVPTVEQAYYESRGHTKTEILTRLIDLYDLKLGIIFCNTKRMVDNLTQELVGRGYSADRIHGGMNQSQRDRVMNRFRTSSLEFLVATDVAARGIDVDNIEVVFNYDLPWDEEDYVHRIGRTGRVGRSGRAITLVEPRQRRELEAIERNARTKIAPWIEGAHVKPEPVTPRPQRHEKPHVRRNGREPHRKLIVGAGRSAGLEVADLVTAVTRATGLDGEAVRNVRVLERFSFLEVPESDVPEVLERVNGTTVNGTTLTLETARN